MNPEVPVAVVFNSHTKVQRLLQDNGFQSESQTDVNALGLQMEISSQIVSAIQAFY